MNWTNEQREELKRLYGKTANSVLAERLGTTVRSVNWQAQHLGLKKDNRKQWTKEDLRILERLYTGGTPTKEIAARFGVTTNAVQKRAYDMGLRFPTAKDRYAKEETWMRLNFPHMTNGVCALLLGVSTATISRVAKRLDLRKTDEFMRECQMFAARKAKESHLRNGTYPPKGVYNANLKKGRKFEFKRKEC